VRGEALRLPFPDSFFDLAVMIGVLEWVGESCPERDPMDVQRQALKNVYTCLKPEGRLFLALENRFGYGYLLGRRDEHTNLPWITLPPRALANLYSLAARRCPYRTYTHSYHALRLLLHEAGFVEAQVYWPVPDYKKPRFIVPLGSKTPLNFLLNNLLQYHPQIDMGTWVLGKLAVSINLQHHFCPTFAVVARKT
jgi:SAM-dependent methyltransferase